jgi:hypothetical protein
LKVICSEFNGQQGGCNPLPHQPGILVPSTSAQCLYARLPAALFLGS